MFSVQIFVLSLRELKPSLLRSTATTWHAITRVTCVAVILFLLLLLLCDGYGPGRRMNCDRRPSVLPANGFQ